MLVCFCTVPKFTRHQDRPREIERGNRGRERKREQGRERSRREREQGRETKWRERKPQRARDREIQGSGQAYRQVRRKALVGSGEGMYWEWGVCGTSKGRLVKGGEFPAVVKILQNKTLIILWLRRSIGSVMKSGSGHPAALPPICRKSIKSIIITQHTSVK